MIYAHILSRIDSLTDESWPARPNLGRYSYPGHTLHELGGAPGSSGCHVLYGYLGFEAKRRNGSSLLCPNWKNFWAIGMSRVALLA